MSRKILLQLLGMTAGLTISAWGHAVGLGGINVETGLGQPLKAEIELVDVNKADKQGLVARLASPDSYKSAGLDYPYGVKYTFQIENRADGEVYLKLSSNQPINDPFVSLLVELSWASGKLMREYTFLLDPPGYVAEQPKAAPIQPVAPEVTQGVKSEKLPEVRTANPPEVSPAKPVEKQAAVAPSANRPAEAKSERVAKGEITVKSGDTLNKIAARFKPHEISLDRMLVALYRANAEQFDGKNMNRIRTGKILRMPDDNALSNVSQTEAVQEIHAQAEDWNAYRQKLAGAASTSRQPSAGAQQVVTGKVTSAAVDKAPVASESAKEVLRLSKGETPGDKAATAGKSNSAQKNAAAEDAIAKAKAVEEEKTRATLLEQNLKEMKRLAELKSEAAGLAASSVAPVSSVAAASAVSAASAVESASAVGAASQVVAASAVKPAAVKPAAAKPVPELSLMDQFLASPLYMGIAAAALLALAGLGLVITRRKKETEAIPQLNDDEIGVVTGHLTSPVMPSPDTGDFTEPAAHAEEVEHHPDDVDPISEADLFLNFGRDEQAEEVLKDALQHSPDNHKVHLKLLGIYANRQDAASFEKIAQMLRDTGDSDAVQQAEVLSQKLVAATPPAKVSVEETAAHFAKPAEDLDETSVTTGFTNEAESSDEPEAIDFDVTSTQPTQMAEMDFDVTSDNHMLAATEGLDFDIASKPSEAEEIHHKEEALPILNDLIFDVTSAPAAQSSEALSAKPMASADDATEFKLDFPLDEPTKAPPPPAINLSDINLDMDSVAAEPAEAGTSEHWHEVATKLDLAKAYQEMGDEVGAREILDEVMQEGDKAQQQEAQLLISQLG